MTKVKTMLLKMEPKAKADKPKPRVEPKPVVKELKQVKAAPPQPQTALVMAAHNNSNQSPVPRKVAVTNSSNSATTGTVNSNGSSQPARDGKCFRLLARFVLLQR